MGFDHKTIVLNGIAFLNWKEGDCQYVSAHFPDRPTADSAAVTLEKAKFKVVINPTPDKPLECDLMASRIFFEEKPYVGKLSETKIAEETVISIEVGDGRNAPEPFEGKPKKKGYETL